LWEKNDPWEGRGGGKKKSEGKKDRTWEQKPAGGVGVRVEVGGWKGTRKED